jgi:hypothetical protein
LTSVAGAGDCAVICPLENRGKNDAASSKKTRLGWGRYSRSRSRPTDAPCHSARKYRLAHPANSRIPPGHDRSD